MLRLFDPGHDAANFAAMAPALVGKLLVATNISLAHPIPVR
jgi:hypothetical protein